MRYQVEIDGEAVALFQYVSWAVKWAQEYADSATGSNGICFVPVVVVDVINDDVLKSWG